MRKVHIQTWGCQMNVADSDRMLALLAESHYTPTNRPEDADVVILNTCHIREKAYHKVVSRLGELREVKEQRPEMILAVGGCISQMEGKKLAKNLPYLDLIFGPDQIEGIGELIQKTLDDRSKTRLETVFDDSPDYAISLERAAPLIHSGETQVSRFVNIIKGCNNFCTYCVVPYTRGREKSRAVAEIVAEATLQVQRGTREIILLGQNVNSYGLDLLRTERWTGAEGQSPFVSLLRATATIPGLQRLRFVTSNPHDFPEDLPSAYKDIPILVDDLHLPVQSGSNAILERMNRKYTREEYLAHIGKMRAVRPHIAFGSDFIIGFPGETDQDFQDTLSLIDEVRFAYLFAFKFSARPGTAAAKFTDRIPDHVADRRLQQLLRLHQTHVEAMHKQEMGRIHKILIMHSNSREKQTWFGRTFSGRLVRIAQTQKSQDLAVGMTVSVEITDWWDAGMEGRIVSN